MKLKYGVINSYVVPPMRKNLTDAGIDLFAYGDYIILKGEIGVVKTGVYFNFPEGYFGLLKPKSRSNFDILAGVVDEGYQGQILFKVYNPNTARLFIKHGEPVGQLLLIPTIYPELEDNSMLTLYEEESERGATGGIVKQ